MDEKRAGDRAGGGPKDTTAYSASKAPETQREAEEKEPVRDFRLIPGGRHGSEAAIGMSGMDRADVPSEGIDPGMTRYGDSPESA
jgi:hypothetical protein